MHKSNLTNVPAFSFDSKVAHDWWAGANFNSRATVDKNYAGSEPIDKLPVAGRVINQGGSEAKPVNGCFVMLAYYDYSMDTDAIRKTKEDGMTAKSQLIMQRGKIHDMTISTPEGIKTYQLYQYGISGPGSDTMQRGIELAYAKLSNGYISVEGDCQKPTQLDGTVLGIHSISLTK